MGTSAPPAMLWDALELEAAPSVLAIVGGGGKTSLLYRLGREARAFGRRAVLSGTTRFTPAARDVMPPLVTAPDEALPDRVERALREHAVVVATTGRESQGRLAAIAPETAARLAALDGLGLLALEADGSKLRPFKAPAEHEPVVPGAATHVVAVVGLDALGAPLDDEHVHRVEQVRAIAGEAERCDEDLIARVLQSPDGGRKGVERRCYSVLVNKADLSLDRALALARTIRDAGVERVIVASLRDEVHPVRAVLT